MSQGKTRLRLMTWTRSGASYPCLDKKIALKSAIFDRHSMFDGLFHCFAIELFCVLNKRGKKLKN